MSKIIEYIYKHQTEYDCLIITNIEYQLNHAYGHDGSRRHIGWKSLYEEIERGLSPSLEETANTLKETFTESQLKKLKDIL
jgi:hypothetical protein